MYVPQSIHEDSYYYQAVVMAFSRTFEWHILHCHWIFIVVKDVKLLLCSAGRLPGDFASI